MQSVLLLASSNMHFPFKDPIAKSTSMTVPAILVTMADAWTKSTVMNVPVNQDTQVRLEQEVEGRWLMTLCMLS